MERSRFRLGKIAATTVFGTVGVLALVIVLASTLSRPRAVLRDSALERPRPSDLRDDEWDRRAARILEATRGIDLAEHLDDPANDVEVVTRIFRSRRRRADGEWDSMRSPGDAASSLLLRRARATYIVAERAMRSEDPGERTWGLEAIDLLEGRCSVFGPAEDPPGPPYDGPERDRALDQVGTLFLNDPDSEVRSDAIYLTQRFPKADAPPTNAVVDALAVETDQDNKIWMLNLLSARGVEAKVILGACLRGFDDPVTISGAIHDLLTEDNQAVIEDAFNRGDPTCRAGIGETFYRNQDPKPWAEAVILRGLADPEHQVRERFAKGAVVLKPPSSKVREALVALIDETKCAAWALRILDGESGACGGSDEDSGTDK